MLVLTRSRDKVVEIQDRDTGKVLGTVTVLQFRDDGHKVRLGFDFPEQYTIHRQEFAEEIRKSARRPKSAAAPTDRPAAV